MEHFAQSWYWKALSAALVASLLYLGYSISKLAETPIAHAEGRIEVNLAEVGGSHCFGAVPVKVTQ